jgi:integrase
VTKAATTARKRGESSIGSSTSSPATKTATTFEELDSGHLHEYARHLTRKGWTAGTVRTYYAYVSAFCGWAVREGHLAENVAQRRNATEPILDSRGHKSGDQQAWSAEDRQQLSSGLV